MADAVLKIKTTSQYVTVEPDYELGYRGIVDKEGMPGRANLTALESIFAGSPLYLKDDDKLASAADYKQWFKDHVLTGEVDDVMTVGSFNLDYANAPNLNNVDTGGGGLPATPFVPNPVSPGAGSLNPMDQKKAPDMFVKNQTPSAWGDGGSMTIAGTPSKTDSTRNPKDTSKKIVEESRS